MIVSYAKMAMDVDIVDTHMIANILDTCILLYFRGSNLSICLKLSFFIQCGTCQCIINLISLDHALSLHCILAKKKETILVNSDAVRTPKGKESWEGNHTR